MFFVERKPGKFSALKQKMVSAVGFQMVHIFPDVFYHSTQYFRIGSFFVIKEIPKK